MKKSFCCFALSLLLCTPIMAEEWAKVIILRPFNVAKALGSAFGGKNSTLDRHYLEIDGQFLGNISLSSMCYYEFKLAPGQHTIIGYVGSLSPEDVKEAGPTYTYSLNVEAGQKRYIMVNDTKTAIGEIDEKQWKKHTSSSYPVQYIMTLTLRDEVFYDSNGKPVASTTRPEVVSGQITASSPAAAAPAAPVGISAIQVDDSKTFAISDASSVLATYNNEFSKLEMPDRDDTFPYALFRVRLTGDARLVRMAKQQLTLNMGQMFQTERTITSYDNMILFLVPRGAKNIYLTCGDGCERILIYSGSLESNKIYDGTVKIL